MSDELFPVQESRNALSSARRDLARALENDEECHDEPSAMWVAQARERVAELERAEIAAWKTGGSK